LFALAIAFGDLDFVALVALVALVVLLASIGLVGLLVLFGDTTAPEAVSGCHFGGWGLR